MLLTEFDQKKHDKNMWQEGYSEGHESGYTEGRDMTIEIIKAINEGNVTVDSLIKMGFDSELVKDILDKYK